MVFRLDTLKIKDSVYRVFNSVFILVKHSMVELYLINLAL